MIRHKLRAWPISSLTAVLLIISSCGGGGGDGVSSSIPVTITNIVSSEITMAERLITSPTNSTNPQIWSCLGDDGLLYGYTFYDRGVIDDIDAYLGLGVVFLPDSPRFEYSWSAVDLSTLHLDSPLTQTRDIWTEIQFSDDDRMRVVSRSVGVLNCSKTVGDSA